MWDRVLTTFQGCLEKAETVYVTKARSTMIFLAFKALAHRRFSLAFNCTEEENEISLSTLRRRAWDHLRAKIDEQTADPVILSKLRGHFEERFRYDEQGVPRVWKPEDDIDGAFKKAKDEVSPFFCPFIIWLTVWQTLELIPLYSRIEPVDSSLKDVLPTDSVLEGDVAEEFDPIAAMIVFSESKAIDLTNKFRRDADAYYVEAKRSTVSSIAQIPYWMYGVLVVLGWNEAMAVLFNPLYFTMLAIAIVTAYVLHLP
jgi:protein SEY1